MPQRILTLCTGNAARSVMLGVFLEHLAGYSGSDLVVRTAGTLTISQQPAGMRVRDAIRSIPELEHLTLGHHRSTQLDDELAGWADLIVAMERDHVRYVRRQHPEAAARTATIYRLLEGLDLEEAPLSQRVAALGLGEVAVEGDREVLDPAGHEAEVYEAVARELWALSLELHARLEASALP